MAIPSNPSNTLSLTARNARVTNALQTHPLTCNILITLLRAAANSSRASTTVRLIPSHPSFKDVHAEIDVHALRTTMKTLSATITKVDESSPDSRSLAVYEAALFGTRTDASLVVQQDGSAMFRAQDCVGRETIRLVVSPALGTTSATTHGSRTERRQTEEEEEVKIGYHGSPVENWYAILHDGLRVMSGMYVSNGRVFGDGVYLAEDFDTAAAFSPFSHVGNDGVCVVGEFEIRGDSRMVRRHGQGQGLVPEGYIVVGDASLIQLRALHVLWKRRRANADVADVRWWMRKVKSLDWVVVVVGAYVLVLMWMMVM